MVRRTAFIASDLGLIDAAADVRGNAVDLVASAVLLAAARNENLLLGSVELLVMGPGVGAQALDGRVRQPGLGEKRPRGFLEAAPETAYVGAPALPSAMYTALASFGTRTPGSAFAEAARLAKASNAARAEMLSALGRLGPRGMLEFREPLLITFGPRGRGLLSEEDLVPMVSPVRIEEDGAGVLRAPWASDAEGPEHGWLTLAAVDDNGVVAVAACTPAHHPAAPVAELGVAAPLVATPVMRGVPRVAPQTPCGVGATLLAKGRAALVLASRTAGETTAAEARLRRLHEPLPPDTGATSDTKRAEFVAVFSDERALSAVRGRV